MSNTDKCISFHLEGAAFKGHFCRLEKSITNALELHNYPKKINLLLSEMAAISQCFSMDVKSESKTTMQLTGTSPVKLALVNTQDCEFFRCCATLDSKSELQKINFDTLSVPNLFGQNGKLLLTIEFQNQHYQTIVELAAETFQECFQHYFLQSQQIPTIVMIVSASDENGVHSGALILQKVPQNETQSTESEDLWHDISCFAATIKSSDLLDTNVSMERFIHLVFGEFHPVVSRETFLEFRCSCSMEKIENLIRNLDDVDGKTDFDITCEYCNKNYRVDKSTIDT